MPAPGCGAQTRRKVLTTLFDGVPSPKEETGAESSATPSRAAAAKQSLPAPTEHEPYRAKSCGECHVVAAANGLVAPKTEICLRCHDFKPDKKYLHPPFESGECLECHDPHSSRYPRLLRAAVEGVCGGCHDAETLAGVAAHKDTRGACTSCHDPHGSDKEHFLK